MIYAHPIRESSRGALRSSRQGNYLGWLCWDQRYDVGGVETGPYQAWQVAGLVIGLAVVSLLAAWRGHPAVAIAVVPAVMTLCFAFDAAPDSPLLVIGAVLARWAR